METILVIWYLKNLKTFWGHKNGITNNWFNEWIKHSFLYSSNSYSQLDIFIQFISPNINRKVRSSTTLTSFPLRLVFLLLRGNDKARKDWSPKAHNWKNKNISHKAHVPTQPNWMHEGRTKGLSLIIWVIIAKRDLWLLEIVSCFSENKMKFFVPYVNILDIFYYFQVIHIFLPIKRVILQAFIHYS